MTTGSRLIRTVSLNAETDLLAEKIPNFSAWVRKKLLEEKTAVQMTHVTQALFEKNGVCNPSAHPRCGICFPYGKPSQSQIRNYNQNKNVEQLLNAVGNNYNWHIPSTIQDSQKLTILDCNEEIKKEPLDPPLREKKYLRRTLKWIWAYI